jgi:cob(I)alamin adenosyltransferase
LVTTQRRLFELGADLASPRPAADKVDKTNRISATHGVELERHIDAVCDHLPAMKHFILPGGCELAARLHVARTICRRAERLCVSLSSRETIGADIVIYLNRLSDLLFAMSRRANQLAGVDDVPWH